MDDRTVTEYRGARVTPRLVNRTELLDKIKRAIYDAPRSHVIYITGDGGMGKTFLSREVLQRCREGGEWFTPDARLMVATDLVDLYHTYTHSKEGLPDAIFDVLGSARADLVNYERKRARYQREKFDLAGMLRELSTLRDEVAQAFLGDLNCLAKKQRLVLALDTAEKLLYETDGIQQLLGLEESGTEVLDWLLNEFLPKLENAVILIAGRRQPERLRTDLRKALGDRLIVEEVAGFDKLDDALDYFDAVAEAVRAEGKIEIAERIAAVPPETREVIWRYTLGRPILLSLMVDYLIVADELLPIVKESVESARQKSKEELKAIERQIEGEVVRHFQNTGRRGDEAIRALAWARKGLDVELLTMMADMTEAEAKAALADLEDLSFIKIRPGDQRLFLHDEMYDMFQAHVLRRMSGAQKARAFGAILRYYEKKIALARNKVAELQRPIAEGTEKDMGLMAMGQVRTPEAAEALARAIVDLYTLIPEEVYYRLRSSPVDGFRAYRAYRREAFWINSDSLDMQLHDEMRVFLSEQGDATQFGDLQRSDVEIDEGLAWIERSLRKGKYSEALGTIRNLRAKRPDLLENQGSLARAQLNAVEGEALTYDGKHLGEAERLLRSAIVSLERMEDEGDPHAWPRDVSLANALNTQGYLYRILGRYRDAISEYLRVPPLWRRLAENERALTVRSAIEAQHANTLNNLSWALAWVGDFEQALDICRDGLKMRQRLGSAAPIAFSLNTMGLIQVKHGQPYEGRVNCQRALTIFRDLGQPRGVGLARVALAEANRRLSNTPDLYRAEERARLLRLAADHAQEGIDLFANVIPELPRLLEALIESGCAYRDWARVRDEYRGQDPDARALARRGEDALFRAIREGEAEPGLLHMMVDAQVNLAWLYHYMHDDGGAKRQADAAIGRVPGEYYITPEKRRRKPHLPQVFLWVQLGKAHLLYAQIAMRQFRESASPVCMQYLITAAHNYTLSLAYDELFAPSFRDMRLGMTLIYDRLKDLNRSEFHELACGVDQAARKYGLKTPTRMHKFLESRFGVSCS